MAKQKSIILKLVVCLGACWIATVGSQTVQADVAAESVDILTENLAGLDALQQAALAIDPDATIHLVDEIGLIRITSKDRDFKTKLESVQSDRIQAIGQLGDMQPEAISLNQVKGYKQAVLPEVMSPLARSEEADLLKELSWHVERVTGESQSLEVSQGSGVLIGVIDSGIDVVHPMLVDHVDLGQAKSYVEGGSGVNDQNGHGTMVSGIIAQTAPDAQITPYRVLGPSGGDSIWTIEAIVQAADDQRDVVNLSLGTYKSVNDESEQLTISAFERAIAYAESKDVIMVTSAGNKGLDLDESLQTEGIRHLPGGVNGVLPISATSKEQNLGSYSNFGSHVKYSAPGGESALLEGMIDLSQWIYGLHPTSMNNGLAELGIPQGYNFSVGTSLSAPLVTGVIADIISHYQKMTGVKPTKEIVMSLLSEGAVDLGQPGIDRHFGNGEVNGLVSLKLIKDTVPPTADFQSKTVEIYSVIDMGEFVVNLRDNVDQQMDMTYEVEPKTNQLGSQQVSIRISDKSQNSTVISGEVEVVDTTPPTGMLAGNLVVFEGEDIDLSALVTEFDDNAGKEHVKISLETDIKKNQLGKQPVVVRLEDKSGNYLLLEGIVEVKAKRKQDDVTTQSSSNKNDVVPEKTNGRSDEITSENNRQKALTLPKTGEEEFGWKTLLFGIQLILMAMYLIYDKFIMNKKE